MNEAENITNEATTKRRPVFRNGKFEIELANGEIFSLYPGINAAGVDFTGCDLTMMKLNDSNFDGANFTDSCLDSTDFTNCQMYGAVFDNADLTMTIFWGAKLVGASFRGAPKEACGWGTRFDHADISFAHFTRGLPQAVLQHATAISTYFYETDFTDSNFYMANLTGATLDEPHFYRVNLMQVDLTGATIRKGYFDLMNMENAILYGTTFEDCASDISDKSCNVNMTNVNAQFARFIRCSLPGLHAPEINFADAYFELSQFFQSNFYSACFARMIAISTGFNECDVRYANFAQAEIVLSRFRMLQAAYAKASNTMFTDCFFQDSDLKDARLQDTQFVNCQFSQETSWPDDFLIPLPLSVAEEIPADIRELDEE